ISLVGNDLSVDIKLENNKLCVSDIKHAQQFYIKKSKRNRTFHHGANSSSIYYRENNDNYEEAINRLIGEYNHFFVQRTFMVMVNTILTPTLKSVHYLPASRSGLYQALSAFGQIIAELSKNRSFLSKKIELPSISEPVSDYFIKLSDIRVVKRNY
ncbi:hypothetical protein K7204_005517, partial [Escherichia coli]|nr:hypothetical protein [Escherichia coli]